LEGELSRSMQTIEGIQGARVHLVVPERQIFSRDDQQPSASVVLKTSGKLDRGQVRAVQHMVAAAVSGLGADRVAIVDDRGNLLAGGDNKSGPDALARAQDEDTANYENSLRSRIEAIVSSVVGMGRVQVQVAADINYNHTQTTSETFDPDSKVARSTQTVEQNASNTSGGTGAAVSVASALPGGQAGPAPGGEQSRDSSGRTEETINYENSLRSRIEAIVSSVVGMGRVQVQVAADINYNHTQTTSETYDPDSKVVRSTQTVEQNASNTSGSTGAAVSVASALPGGQAAPASGDQSRDTSGRTEETTNYEISKKVTTSTVDGGEVKKLSVAVVVDGSGDTAAAYKPRSADEMNKITALVKSAMGFDPARGDQVQVTNMQFARMDQTVGTEAPKPLLGLDSSYWFKIIEAGIMCLTALLIGLFVAKPLINRMFTAQALAAGGPTALSNASPVAGALPAPGAAAGEQPLSADGTQALPAPSSGIDVSRIDGQVRESSIKKVGEVVSAHPEEALAIIRTWLHQPV
jgi:flagellar biosynthesis/type III secretory pathway M-ring protein FliF/YscJ